MLLSSQNRRRGATAVEAAVVFNVVFLLFLGLLVGGMGVFRFQEVAWLARDAARFASTHGGQYAVERSAAIAAGNPNYPNADKAYITNTFINGQAASMDSTQLTTTVTITTWQGTYDWDDLTDTFSRWPTSLNPNTSPTNPNGSFYQNTVTVTVSYNLIPEWGWAGPITLTSKSVMPMSY
jgi:hypothetical protein